MLDSSNGFLTIPDKRSRKIVVTAHCFLNQNAKLEGIASRPGIVDEIIEAIQRSKAGILQMPCPEMIYEGIGRLDKSIEQYQCAGFLEVCSTLSKTIVDQIENYIQWGYSVLAFVMADGSPSCGLTKSQSAPEWRGLLSGKQWPTATYLKQPGIFTKLLQESLRVRNLEIPFFGIPETPEVGDFKTSLSQLTSVLENT